MDQREANGTKRFRRDVCVRKNRWLSPGMRLIFYKLVMDADEADDARFEL
jgi:hypothetical protein